MMMMTMMMMMTKLMAATKLKKKKKKEVNSDGSVKKGRRDGKALYIIQRTISSLGIPRRHNRKFIQRQKSKHNRQ
jgi:hypothetical protein